MLSMLAQVVQGRGGDDGLLHLFIVIIIAVAAVAILIVVLKAMGYAVPQWVWAIVGILAAAFVGIFALKFLWSMAW